MYFYLEPPRRRIAEVAGQVLCCSGARTHTHKQARKYHAGFQVEKHLLITSFSTIQNLCKNKCVCTFKPGVELACCAPRPSIIHTGTHRYTIHTLACCDAPRPHLALVREQQGVHPLGARLCRGVKTLSECCSLFTQIVDD